MSYIRPTLRRAPTSFSRATSSYRLPTTRGISTAPRVVLVESRTSDYDPSYSSRPKMTHRQPEIVTVTRPVARNTVDTTNYYPPPPAPIPDMEWTRNRNETAQTTHASLEQEKTRLPKWQQAVVDKGEQLEVARRAWQESHAHLKTVNATFNGSLGYTEDGLVYSGASFRPPYTESLMNNKEAARVDNRKAQKDYEDQKFRIASMRYDGGLIELGSQLEAARHKWDGTAKDLTAAYHRAGREVKLVRAGDRYSESPYYQPPQQSEYSYLR